jgi:hypothetical protein
VVVPRLVSSLISSGIKDTPDIPGLCPLGRRRFIKNILWILHCRAGFGSLNVKAVLEIAHVIRCILLFLMRKKGMLVEK